MSLIMTNYYKYKHPPDLERLKVKIASSIASSSENLDNFLDKLSTPQMLAMFFRMTENLCEKCRTNTHFYSKIE